jgi:alanyl-tRNA synthetase
MDNVKRTKNNLNRAGDWFLLNILRDAEAEEILNGDDALKIFNTLGMPLETIILIANSHGITVDEEEFNLLLDAQKERSKNMRQC